MAYISKEEYQRARQICIEYEAMQRRFIELRKTIEVDFPIGEYAYSKLNHTVRGKIIGYGQWRDIPSIRIEDVLTGRKNTILVTNAVKV